jgi:hypothetical protein
MRYMNTFFISVFLVTKYTSESTQSAHAFFQYLFTSGVILLGPELHIRSGITYPVGFHIYVGV